MKLLATGRAALYAKQRCPKTIEIILNRRKVRDIEHMDSKGKEWCGDA